MLPCSQSTRIQSNPALAIVLDRCDPGSICQAPNVKPLPLLSAARSVLAFCITDAMLAVLCPVEPCLTEEKTFEIDAAQY